ncbi:hypothetical protein [Sphingobium aquiterrae]|uniref:hypothetical protein n=1 Tax=Sphingobium aquiterrae TaxID=2038656 RepID=UPI003018DD4F
MMSVDLADSVGNEASRLWDMLRLAERPVAFGRLVLDLNIRLSTAYMLLRSWERRGLLERTVVKAGHRAGHEHYAPTTLGRTVVNARLTEPRAPRPPRPKRAAAAPRPKRAAIQPRPEPEIMRTRRVHYYVTTIKRQSAGHKRLWTAMRVLRTFDLAQLVMAAEVKRDFAARYVRLLVTAGYLAPVWADVPSWRLCRNSGPLYPQMMRRSNARTTTALYDQNWKRPFSVMPRADIFLTGSVNHDA